jgi:aspartyl-tRNA(Asn)/glutamyl-tRNA(Gln) amidotransferase subunit B
MNNFKPTIGIEIHTQVNTKTKMFSPSANNSNSIPNTNICEYDVALPGSMPQPNKEVVVKAIQFAKALNMQLDQSLRFDRKNYFYSDLPKGYQITQQYFPIAKNGKIKISDDKSIEIERFHLEEDTAKQIYETDEIKLDYNRSGIPLIEIVSCPQISSGEEAVLYLTKIKQILTFLEISDGKMEDGSLRVDVNISVSENEKLGTKVEIKNINSFSNAKRAIEFEIKRQEEILSSSNLVIQETRR